MQQDAREAYLETQIMTATPQKLRLMLIDGAIRSAMQIVDHWKNERIEEGCESLIRCREIIAELLSSVRVGDSDVSRDAAQIYAFLFRSLTLAQMERDIPRILDATKVLKEERQTWQMVCEQMPDPPMKHESADLTNEITASNSNSIPPSNSPLTDSQPVERLSLDA